MWGCGGVWIQGWPWQWSDWGSWKGSGTFQHGCWRSTLNLSQTSQRELLPPWWQLLPELGREPWKNIKADLKTIYCHHFGLLEILNWNSSRKHVLYILPLKEAANNDNMEVAPFPQVYTHRTQVFLKTQKKMKRQKRRIDQAYIVWTMRQQNGVEKGWKWRPVLWVCYESSQWTLLM